MCFLNKLRSVDAVALTACPWPAASARTIRESKPGEADRKGVNVTALCCGWQCLGMDRTHESGISMMSTMSFSPQTSEQANLWIGIRSEPGPHVALKPTSKLNMPIPLAFPSKSIPSVIVGFRRRAKVTALGVRRCRTSLPAELGRIRLSLFWES
jgi:hypothetical protein